MNIAEIIAALTGGANPNQAIMEGATPGLPPQVANAQAAAPAPAPTTAPQGAKTPVTNPQDPASAPKITQSPPDLANMYIELMRKNENARQLDSGLHLIAAGFSKYPENRAALIAGSNRAGTGGMSLSPQDLINFQKQRTEQQNLLLRQSMLGGLMKQYGMSDAQIKYLEASGKLDEVIKHYSTENLAHIEDKATGKTLLWAPRTGKVVAELGGEKPDETQVVEGPQGSELRSKKTFERIGEPVGLKPDQVVITRPDKSQFIANKNDPTTPIRELAPAEKPGDIIVDTRHQLEGINKERAARGEKLMTEEELIKLKQPPGTQVYVGQDGSQFRPPPEGQDYVRTPDGKIKIGPDGRPELYDIKGGPAERKTEQYTKEKADADKKLAKQKVQAAFTASNVGKAVDSALAQVDKAGVTGIGSKWSRALPGPGGMSWDEYDAAIDTIKSNVAFETLAQMRQASPTGGALGNITDFEQKMLASVIDSLATYRHTDKAKGALIRVKAAMEVLADENFNQDPAKFQEALNKRVDELTAEQAAKKGVTAKRRQ